MGSLVSIMHLVIRNMWSRKCRTLLSISGIVLGVAVVLATDITHESTLASIHRIFNETSGRAHLVVTSNSVMGDPFSPKVLYQVGKVPGVHQVIPSVRQMTVLAGEAEETGLILSHTGVSTAEGLLVFGVDPAIDQLVRDYELAEGTFLPNERDAYRVLLVKDYADDQGLGVGDDLTILVSHSSESFRIVGLIRKTGPGLQNNGAVAIVPLGAAQTVFDMGNDLSQLDLMVEPAIAQSALRLDEFKSRLGETLGPGCQVTYPATRGAVVSKMLDSYQAGLQALTLVILFTGAFIIYNTFMMTVVERTREIGMLRTLGMTQSQITLLVLSEALLVGVVGSAAGAGFGIVLTRGLMRWTGALTTSEVTQVTIPVGGLLTALLLGLVVTLVSASLPAWRARNISPLDTLRVRARPQREPLGRYGWLVGVGLIAISYLAVAWLALIDIPLRPELKQPVLVTIMFVLLLGGSLAVPVTIDRSEQLLRPMLTAAYGNEGRLGAINIHRAKARTALTVAALMVGISVIIAVQTGSTNYKVNLDNWAQTAYGADLYVRSAVPVCTAAIYGDLHIRPPTRMREELGRRLLTEPTVEAVSPITCHLVRRVPPSGDPDQADTLAFIGIDPTTYPQVASFVFEDSKADLSAVLAELSTGDALLISTTLADRYGLSTGDMLRLETRRGRVDFRVAGVVLDFSRQGYVITGARAALKRYFGESHTHEFLVALKPGVEAGTEAERLEQRYGRSHQIAVSTMADFREKVNDHTAQACAFYDVLALVGVIIATLGVVNTVMMNVFERRREIGGLRSMGMTRTQVIRMMLAESGAMGAIGGLFGLVLGFIYSKESLLGLQVLTGFRMDYNMPPVALGVSVVIALLVSQVAAIFPAWYAANMRIIETIQHE